MGGGYISGARPNANGLSSCFVSWRTTPISFIHPIVTPSSECQHRIWIGPAARKRMTEVEFYGEQMCSLVSRAIKDVEDTLKNTPKEVDSNPP